MLDWCVAVNYIKRFFRGLQREGLTVVLYKYRNYRKYKNSYKMSVYKKWLAKVEKNCFDIEALEYNPLISVVVPVYNVTNQALVQCIESVLKQTYPNFELCIVNYAFALPEVKEMLSRYKENGKVKIQYYNKRGYISECINSAIKLAKGEFIAFLDCSDALAPNALYEVAKLLNEKPELDFIYSDEDRLTEDGLHRHSPHFKPDWSPDTMMSFMYTNHLGIYRKALGDKIGWLRSDYEGAQDYDFALRYTEQTNHIGHIAKILYHSREHRKSAEVNTAEKQHVIDAVKRVKEEALKRRGYQGSFRWLSEISQFQVCYEPVGAPLVSVIVPSKNNFEVYKRCMDTLIERTKYTNYEIITVDNGSNEENRRRYERYAKKHKITYLYQPMEYNFSKMCNIGVKNSHGSYGNTADLILFLNDDMEIITEEWMGCMAGHAMLPYIGAVGAKLLYPNSSLIQHVGVVSFDIGPSHTLCQCSDNDILYFNRNRIEYNYSAVTGACLMVSRKKYDEVGGLDESFAVAYNDVKFCFDLHSKGYYNVVRTDAVLYHYESLSRGSDVLDVDKFERLKGERERLYRIHPEFAFGDCFYNPNLTMRRGDFSINQEMPEILWKSSVLPVRKLVFERQGTENVCASLEDFVVTSQYIHARGWFILKDSAFNNEYKTVLCLKGERYTYQFSSQRIYRRELGMVLHIPGKISMSAFEAVAERNKVVPGCYHIFLKKHGVLWDTGREVEI